MLHNTKGGYFHILIGICNCLIIIYVRVIATMSCTFTAWLPKYYRFIKVSSCTPLTQVTLYTGEDDHIYRLVSPSVEALSHCGNNGGLFLSCGSSLTFYSAATEKKESNIILLQDFKKNRDLDS